MARATASALACSTLCAPSTRKPLWRLRQLFSGELFRTIVSKTWLWGCQRNLVWQYTYTAQKFILKLGVARLSETLRLHLDTAFAAKSARFLPVLLYARHLSSNADESSNCLPLLVRCLKIVGHFFATGQFCPSFSECHFLFVQKDFLMGSMGAYLSHFYPCSQMSLFQDNPRTLL